PDPRPVADVTSASRSATTLDLRPGTRCARAPPHARRTVRRDARRATPRARPARTVARTRNRTLLGRADPAHPAHRVRTRPALRVPDRLPRRGDRPAGTAARRSRIRGQGGGG